MDSQCSICGAEMLVAEQVAYRGVCETCWSCREDNLGARAHDRREITGRKFNIPAGMSITERTRVPGSGEGNDYFGNHT